MLIIYAVFSESGVAATVLPTIAKAPGRIVKGTGDWGLGTFYSNLMEPTIYHSLLILRSLQPEISLIFMAMTVQTSYSLTSCNSNIRRKRLFAILSN